MPILGAISSASGHFATPPAAPKVQITGRSATARGVLPVVMLESDPLPFCQQLRQCRDRAGLSQLALAVQAGTSPRHIAFIEAGNLRPGVDLVRRLADALSVPGPERSRLLVAAEMSL